MNILFWIILGGIAGWITSKIMKIGSENWIKNVFLGIVGAMVGGFAMNFMGMAGITGFNMYSLLVAVAGSVLTLYVIGRM